MKIPDVMQPNRSMIGSLGAIKLAGTETINFADLNPAERRWSSVLFAREGEHGVLERELLVEFEGLRDFVGFRPRYLFTASYYEEGWQPCNDPLVSILNRIYAKHKQRIGRFQNLIFFDPITPFPYALRAAHTDVRVFVVLTPDASDDSCVVYRGDVDVLIVSFGNSLATARGFRRKYVYQDATDLAGVLRQAIIEAGPKRFNMLLPVLNGLEYAPELFDRDTTRLDGIIVVRESAPSSTTPVTFKEFVEALANSVEEILLSEETYLRYRTLCDEAASEVDWAEFLLISLKDGARYEVRA